MPNIYEILRFGQRYEIKFIRNLMEILHIEPKIEFFQSHILSYKYYYIEISFS